MKNNNIKLIKARKILNSRCELTVEAEVETDKGLFIASVPAGASKGKYEAKTVEPLKAIENIEQIIAPKLIGQDSTDQKKIDEILIQLDNTKDKSNLGANAILAVSTACCRAGAGDVPLYQHINKKGDWLKPMPCFNILNGGAHAGNDLDIQEFMIVPQEETFEENVEKGAKIYQALKEILKKKYGKSAINLGDEGGFAPNINKTKQALDLIMQASELVGYSEKIRIGIDCAANQFYKNGIYEIEEEKKTSLELLEFYKDITNQYPILFLEDPFAEDDLNGFAEIMKDKGSIENIIADDLTVTNPEKIEMAKEKNLCNGIILKPNQIGTITEAIKAGELAKKFGWKIIVSHRSGDTCDNFIADLAVAISADFIKSGAPARGERISKYNRLLRI
jgi:enolase